MVILDAKLEPYRLIQACLRQYVLDALDPLCAVLDSQRENAARSVGERNDGFQHAVWRREIALELQRFAFGPTEQGDQAHNSAFDSEA
jgi:hypothetical protein